jgi:hypothetical protein
VSRFFYQPQQHRVTRIAVNQMLAEWGNMTEAKPQPRPYNRQAPIVLMQAFLVGGGCLARDRACILSDASNRDLASVSLGLVD